MKVINIEPSTSRVVSYYGAPIPLVLGECFVAADLDGSVWAFAARPHLRRTGVSRGMWSVQPGDRMPRCIGQVALGNVNWKDSMVDYGLDPKDASNAG